MCSLHIRNRRDIGFVFLYAGYVEYALLHQLVLRIQQSLLSLGMRRAYRPVEGRKEYQPQFVLRLQHDCRTPFPYSSSMPGFT